MDASSAPAGRTETETRDLSQGGAVDASSTPVGSLETETRGSSQRGAVDASSVPIGRAESDLSATSTSLPTPTKGTVRAPPRSFWIVYVALFPS